ncbi:MAG TPA: hypothetical protein VEZ24_06065 [Microvirga sp.]|nr:hypothetical protein [Microvirga sp.]
MVAMTETNTTMSKPETPAVLTIETSLEAICLRHRDASAVAQAALTCAQAGASGYAVEMALPLEEPVREARTLLNVTASSTG